MEMVSNRRGSRGGVVNESMLEWKFAKCASRGRIDAWNYIAAGKSWRGHVERIILVVP
jgi:hypothetical protein